MPAAGSIGPLRATEIERPDVVAGGRLRLIGFPGKPPPMPVVRMPLELRSYENAVAAPLVGYAGGNQNVGAAYDATGRLIVESQRAKPAGRWKESPAELPAGLGDPIELTGRTFFAGRHPPHFGHILLEMLTRFWPQVDYDRYDHFLTIPSFGANADSGAESLFGRLVTAAGLPYDRFRTVTARPVRCEALDVPSAPFRIKTIADPRFLDPFERMATRVERRSDADEPLPGQIYLSRTRLSQGARANKRVATNEAEVEALMTSRGFEVVHPQELPLHRQIALVRRARVIAGCNGTALHLAMFSRPGTRLLALDALHVTNQYLIDRARGLDAVHVWAATEEVTERSLRWTVDVERVAAALEFLPATRLAPTVSST